LLSIYVPLSYALGTYRDGGTAPSSGGSDEEGCAIVFHGTLGIAIPPAKSAFGGSAGSDDNAVTFIQDEYQQHNVKFNAAEVPTYGDPPDEKRNDFDRMATLASARAEQEKNNHSSQSGSFTIFPGDQSLALGTAANGGSITSIRHDYDPYFKTRFTTDNTWQTRTIEDKLEDETSKVEHLVNLAGARARSAKTVAKKAGSKLSSAVDTAYLRAAPSAFGPDVAEVSSAV